MKLCVVVCWGVLAIFISSRSQADSLANFSVAGGSAATDANNLDGLYGVPGATYPPYTGPGAVAGNTHTTWTPIVANGVAHDASGVTFTEIQGEQYTGFSPGGTSASPQSLLDSFAVFSTGGRLDNVAAGTYDVYIYDQNGKYGGRGDSFTIGSTTLSTFGLSTGGGDTSFVQGGATYVDGSNYVVFTGITLTAPGSISFTEGFNGRVGGSLSEGDFNGIQLVQAAVPAPLPVSAWSGACLLGSLFVAGKYRSGKDAINFLNFWW